MSGNHALAWFDGTVYDLGTLPGGANSFARAVNDSGHVAGWSEIEPGGRYHAVKWEDAIPIDLGTLPGHTHSMGIGMNEAGHVIGLSIGPANVQSSFFWNGTAMSEIPMPPGGYSLEASAINNSDQVVGHVVQYEGRYQSAFLWEATTNQIVDLQTLLPSGSGWQLDFAHAINDAGQISGYGVREGCLRAFLMTPATAPAPDDTSVEEVQAGESTSTDTRGPGATGDDPVATTIESPVDGVITIREGFGASGVSDFTLLGQPITINAPDASIENPYRLTFTFDSSLVPPGEDETTIQVFRDGDMAGPCNSSEIADPDPCVLARTLLSDGDAAGDIQITVLTSHASVWGAYVPDGPSFAFEGFFHPVNNAPTLNVMKAGAGVPVKFSLGGDFGLDVLAGGSPSSRAIDCTTGQSTDSVELTVAASSSRLSYDPATDTYTYLWKTTKSWTGCREFVLTLSDGTEHAALFQFKR